jgi:hypothetical protein
MKTNYNMVKCMKKMYNTISVKLCVKCGEDEATDTTEQ